MFYTGRFQGQTLKENTIQAFFFKKLENHYNWRISIDFQIKKTFFWVFFNWVLLNSQNFLETNLTQTESQLWDRQNWLIKGVFLSFPSIHIRKRFPIIKKPSLPYISFSFDAHKFACALFSALLDYCQRHSLRHFWITLLINSECVNSAARQITFA